jgi:hypothetical protein
VRRIVVRIALVLGAGGIVTLPAVSQARPHERNGFLIGFGIGGGSGDVSFDGGSDTDREGGVGGNFRVGYATRPDLTVHFEASSWLRDEDEVSLSFTLAAAALTFYPGNAGFFVRGGVGFGTSRWDAQVGEPFEGFTLSKNETGLGLLGAAGYEVRLSRKFALGPQVDYAYLFVGGDLVDSANFVNGSLQFNWYW